MTGKGVQIFVVRNAQAEWPDDAAKEFAAGVVGWFPPHIGDGRLMMNSTTEEIRLELEVEGASPYGVVVYRQAIGATVEPMEKIVAMKFLRSIFGAL